MSKRKSTPDVMGALQGLGAPTPPPRPVEQPVVGPPPRREEAPAPSRRAKNRTPRSRLVGRATYDIGPELKAAIHQESVALGVPASQLAKYLLLFAWDFYTNQEIPEPELLKSDSPKFRNTIKF